MDEVKRQIEQVLVAHTTPSNHRKGTELASQQVTTVSRDPERGAELDLDGAGANLAVMPSASNLAGGHERAAHQVTRACDTTASDIEDAAEVLLKVASGISEESRQLAELLRRHGKLIANRIEEFTAMTQRVALKMREARADVLGSSENGVVKLPGTIRDDTASIRVDNSE
jgi:hypothetical protein